MQPEINNKRLFLSLFFVSHYKGKLLKCHSIIYSKYSQSTSNSQIYLMTLVNALQLPPD